MDSLVWFNTLISLAFCLSPSVLLYKADLLGFFDDEHFCLFIMALEQKMFGGKKVMFYTYISNNGRTC